VTIIIFLFGAILGSFANVVIVRLKEASSLWGRSRCPACKTRIRPHHLVPIISWMFLRGRCASCGKKISIHYPLVELLAGALAVLAALQFDPFLSVASLGQFLSVFFFFWWLLVCAVFDLRWKLLPVEFMAVGTVFFLLLSVGFGSDAFFSSLIGLGVGAGFFGLQYGLSRGAWVGLGDVWLGGLLGAGLGWPRVGFALAIAYAMGAIVALVLLLAGIVTRKTRLPLAPFLAAGSLAVFLFAKILFLFA
jgi:prepilin signal peptidase PulO-like enzyme (type II secretory pathway)